MSYKFISVILPIRNEQNFIRELLNSIFLQNYPKEMYEVIVCDGMSEDRTLDIVTRFQSKNNNLKIIQNKKKIVPVGFNIGLNEAVGDIIIRLDGHCKIDTNYFSNCLKLLNENNNDIVGGIIDTISTGNIGNAISIAQSSIFGVGGVRFRSNYTLVPQYVNTLAFGAHKRELFSEIGGYDEEMVCNQDDEFNYRAIQAKKKIFMDPAIVTQYFSRSTFKNLFKQYFNYGFYKVRVIQKRQELFSLRHIIPSIFVLAVLFSLLEGYFSQNPLIAFSVILLYLLINSIISIFLATKFLLVPLLCFSFYILHFSYGIGFIMGLVLFCFKWHDNDIRDLNFNKENFLSNKRVL